MSRFAEQYGPWALVTGASSGIGAEFARQIAGRGINTALVARRGERLNALAHEIENDSAVETLVIEQDLTEDGAVEAVAEQLGNREIGLLINNAGVGRAGRFIEQNARDHDRMLDLNCRAPLLLAHRLAQPMTSRNRGGIIFTSSTAGLMATSRLAHYSATKAWEHFMAQALNAELGHEGVDVLSVCPGPTDTEFFGDGEFQPSQWPKLARQQLSRPEDVVHAALDGLGRTSLVVPGVSNKLVAGLRRLVPERLIGRLTDYAMRRVMRVRQSST